MKKIMVFLCMILTSSILSACPTCLGRLEKDSPPFFSARYDAYWLQGGSTAEKHNKTKMQMNADGDEESSGSGLNHNPTPTGELL